MSKFLLIKLRALGDTVILTSSIAALKRARPKAEIHVLAPERWAPVLERHPAIDVLWRWNSGANKLSETARVVPALRAERFDVCVNFHASGTSALLSRLSGAPVRANHFHGHTDENRFSTVEIPGKGELKPIIERDLDALRAVGVGCNPTPAPQIFLTDGERTWGRTQLATQGLGGPVLAIGLGASRPTKVWPMGAFAEVARAWCERTGGSVQAFVAPGERVLGEEFLRALALTPDLPVRVRSDLGVRELAALLSACATFVGNDSGPKHLAVAVGLTTVTIFGPENPFEWHPYERDFHTVHFIDGLSCRTNVSPGGTRWCGIESCVVERHRCMRDITPAAVLASCLSFARAH